MWTWLFWRFCVTQSAAWHDRHVEQIIITCYVQDFDLAMLKWSAFQDTGYDSFCCCCLSCHVLDWVKSNCVCWVFIFIFLVSFFVLFFLCMCVQRLVHWLLRTLFVISWLLSRDCSAWRECWLFHTRCILRKYFHVKEKMNSLFSFVNYILACLVF